MKEISERTLTVGYGCALGLIAALTLSAHITLNRVLAEHEGSAAIVNVSGRQRMLSQRIAGLAAQYRLGDSSAGPEMLRAVNLFLQSHHQLLAQSAGGRSAETFHTLYFGGTAPLDAEVTAFTALARRIAAEPVGSTAMDADLPRLFAEARAPLLERLDRVVAVHQQDSEAQLTRLQWLQRITLLVVLTTLATEALLIFRPMVRRIARYAKDLLRMATTDALTGTLNRYSFVERGEAELLRARRARRPLAVLMLDADHFKRINDKFGHAGGDAVLRALGSRLRAAVRPGDLLGRMGGEEFAVLLPETHRDAAISFAERLRAAIADHTIPFGSEAIDLTISIGVAAGHHTDLETLLRQADQSLYVAKQSGRNRVASDVSLVA